MQALIQSHRTSRVVRVGHFCNMDIVLFLLHIRVLKPLLVFYFRVEEKFTGGKFRGRKISRNSIRSGYYFRGRKISRKIKIRENSENLLHAKNWCYTVFRISAFSLLLVANLPYLLARGATPSIIVSCCYSLYTGQTTTDQRQRVCKLHSSPQ